MKIVLLLLVALLIPQLSVAAVAKYTDENDLELNTDKPSAEVVIFGPLIKVSKEVFRIWNILLDWVSLTKLRFALCRLNNLVVTKAKIDLPINPNCL